FNPYARYGVEHWKNLHEKIFYIRKQQEARKPKEEVYSNSKIVQIIKTYWELGHEHKFITEIVARRANGRIVSITKSDYKNLNKNDIEHIPSTVRPRDQEDPHYDAHPERENSAKRQKTYEHGMFIFRESSSGQYYESEPGPSTPGNQDQSDDFDFWTNSYATDDDVLPDEKVSQDLMDKIHKLLMKLSYVKLLMKC
nr:hypothetical protein [Tanacetum cinerariifolium]